MHLTENSPDVVSFHKKASGWVDKETSISLSTNCNQAFLLFPVSARLNCIFNGSIDKTSATKRWLCRAIPNSIGYRRWWCRNSSSTSVCRLSFSEMFTVVACACTYNMVSVHAYLWAFASNYIYNLSIKHTRRNVLILLLLNISSWIHVLLSWS